MQLEGVAGLLRLAEVSGKLLSSDGGWTSRWELDTFQKKHPTIEVFAVLREAATKNPAIKSYLDSLEESEPASHSRRKKIVGYTYQEILDRVSSPSRFSAFSEKLAALMNVAEVEVLAQQFLKERNVLKKTKYLRFFGVRKFPFAYTSIFKIATKKIRGKSRLVPNAVAALSHFSAPEIRQLALEKISGDEKPDEYILLLRCNLQNEDLSMLMRLIYRSDDFDYIHGLISDLLKVLRNNPSFDSRKPLLAMLDRMNCSIHRKDILRLLHERGQMPEHVFKEMEFDSDEDIRKFFRQIKRDQEKDVVARLT